MCAFLTNLPFRVSSHSDNIAKQFSCVRRSVDMIASQNGSPKFQTTRRSFLATTLSAAAGVSLGTLKIHPEDEIALASGDVSGPFSLPPLPYAYDGLEPRISERIMRAHHDGHFGTYVKNLNAAVADLPNKNKVMNDSSLKELMHNLDSISDAKLRTRIRNNGGGYLNHKLFFAEMSSKPQPLPDDSALANSIQKCFGSIDKLRDTFLAEATSLFGSGFTWLIRDSDGTLSIVRTPNQDNPVMNNQTPILACDCWEHAWYYQYGPAKKDYFPQWWASIDWPVVDHVYTAS